MSSVSLRSLADVTCSALLVFAFLIGACGDSGSGGGSGGSAGLGGSAGGGAGGQGGASDRRMFVTQTVQNADFAGIAGADALCAQEAQNAGLEGDFKAWLSTRSSAVAERLEPSENVRYVLVNGTTVAASWEDLLDGSIAAVIDVTASGVRVTGDVWTGTLANGEAYAADDCDGFASGSAFASGQCGSTRRTDRAWTENVTPSCDTRLRLYCIEQ